MKLGFCTISALDRGLAEAARIARDAGLDGIEVTGRAPHLDPEGGADAAARAADAVTGAGVPVLAYGSYLGRLGPRTPAFAAQEVRAAATLGAPLLRVWSEPLPEEADQGFAVAVELHRVTCDHATERGIDVVVERHIGSFADTPERVDRLLAAVDRPNFALNYQVLDVLPMDEADAQPADAARLVPHARYLHLKNYRPAEAPGGRMLPGGSLPHGALDYRALLRSVVEAGYRGPMTHEFLAFDARPVEEKLAEDVAFVREVLGELGVA